MKLKELYKQVKDQQNQPQVNIEEVKQQFGEQIKEFKNHGKTLYNLGKYKQIAEYFGKLSENAEHYLISESDSWFDNITIKRNIKELKSHAADFQKVSGEAQALQERMMALYEDMGVILNRYFDVPDSPLNGIPAEPQHEDMGEMGIGEAEEQYYRKHKQEEVADAEDELHEAHLPKSTIKKGHEIAKAIKKHHGKVDNPYAVGMATAEKMKEGTHSPLNTSVAAQYSKLRRVKGLSHDAAMAIINKSKQGQASAPEPPEQQPFRPRNAEQH